MFTLDTCWWECVDLQGGEGQSTKTKRTAAQSCQSFYLSQAADSQEVPYTPAGWEREWVDGCVISHTSNHFLALMVVPTLWTSLRRILGIMESQGVILDSDLSFKQGNFLPPQEYHRCSTVFQYRSCWKTHSSPAGWTTSDCYTLSFENRQSLTSAKFRTRHNQNKKERPHYSHIGSTELASCIFYNWFYGLAPSYICNSLLFDSLLPASTEGILNI